MSVYRTIGPLVILTVEDVVFNELLMFKVSIQGYFDNTNSPRFTT